MEHKILKKMNVIKLLLILSFFPFTSFTQNYLDEIFSNLRYDLYNEYSEYKKIDYLGNNSYEITRINDVFVDSLIVLNDCDTVIYYWQKDSIGNKMGVFLEYKKGKYLKFVNRFNTKKFQYIYEYWAVNENKVKYHYYDTNIRKKLFKKRLKRRNYKRQREYYIPPLDF